MPNTLENLTTTAIRSRYIFDALFSNIRNDDSSPFGPLTQRLVQALIEENIMTPIDDGISEAGSLIITLIPYFLSIVLHVCS